MQENPVTSDSVRSMQINGNFLSNLLFFLLFFLTYWYEKYILGCSDFRVLIFTLYRFYVASLNFISPHVGMNLTAGVGSSFNFSRTVGFLTYVGQIIFEGYNVLIRITRVSFVSIKARCVTSIWNNRRRPGQVTFMLNSIRAQDSRHLVIKYSPSSIF